MEPLYNSESRYAAIQDFRRARSQAVMKELLARLTGECTQLLSYDEVLKKLKLQSTSDGGLQDIPLAAIVGSVGRSSDFTSSFLPRNPATRERWTRIMELASGPVGLPPIEVYQIGDAYFVRDGNHRVSVARQTGATYIQAYVTRVQTRVPMSTETQHDDLIILAEYSEFLEQTRLDVLRPLADLRASIPGQYETLLEHIGVHRFFMGLDLQRDISFQEAVEHWYDAVYSPVVQIIQELDILHHFPGRTETDLYIWISEHRAALEEQFGWSVKTEYVASDLLDELDQDRSGWLQRLSRSLGEIAVSEKLAGGPAPGIWRSRLAGFRQDCMFPEILVPVNGEEDGWCAFEQALVLGLREHARMNGLHVVSTEDEISGAKAQAVKTEFEKRCQAASVEGKLVISQGVISNLITRSARLNDLVVVNFSYPPGDQPSSRYSSGFRDLLQHSPRPVVAVPQTVSPLSRALLLFDGSPKSREALFVAAYIAGEWRLPLAVLTVVDGGQITQQTQDQAKEYLENRGIQAEYILESGAVTEAVKWTAADQASDFLLMGGYGSAALAEIVLGSQVDQILRESNRPVFICR